MFFASDKNIVKREKNIVPYFLCLCSWLFVLGSLKVSSY